ncbi:hypothetical protein MRB53_006549 [Persea americana]|uniref:Uncharacterized protein n=1 Tax=Persea americana TaxID=3435 RepID=A0ACC2MGA6_PERAE|nr:hypothetical protein MRB53_006549 [Persea americana]
MRQISTGEGKEIVCIPFQLRLGNRDTETATILSPMTNHLSQDKAAWVLTTSDVQDVSPVASLPIPLQVNLSQSLEDVATSPKGDSPPVEISNQGWVSVVSKRGSSNRRLSLCKFDGIEVAPAASSLERATIHMPGQLNLPNQGTMVEDTGRSQKAYSEGEDQTPGGSGYSDRLSSQIIACGKAVGLSIRDDKNGWENLIRFAQGRVDANNAARVVDRIGPRKKLPENFRA